jgi:hypothetical protein
MGIDARSARRTWDQMDRHSARFAPRWYFGALSGRLASPAIAPGRKESRSALEEPMREASCTPDCAFGGHEVSIL